MFRFELSQIVDIAVSEEFGHVKGRAEYLNSQNQYLVHYRNATGNAEDRWFDEDELCASEDDEHPGSNIYMADKPVGVDGYHGFHNHG